MGFFKEFKDDFSEAVNELVPGAEENQPAEDEMVDTLGENIDVASELSKLDGLLEQVTKRVDQEDTSAEAKVEKTATTEMKQNIKTEEKVEDKVKMDTYNTENGIQQAATSQAGAPIADETAVITAGMSINGNLESVGSINVEGKVVGDIACNGKLVVTGTVQGNSSSSEFFADAAKIEGEVATTGTAKIGVGSVVIGNISAASAVIAGAVKGDIDVQGPVVVDTSAVVMGNIKSRSVQINNGAVIEGFCSQSYADVDVEGLFA